MSVYVCIPCKQDASTWNVHVCLQVFRLYIYSYSIVRFVLFLFLAGRKILQSPQLSVCNRFLPRPFSHLPFKWPNSHQKTLTLLVTLAASCSTHTPHAVAITQKYRLPRHPPLYAWSKKCTSMMHSHARENGTRSQRRKTQALGEQPSWGYVRDVANSAVEERKNLCSFVFLGIDRFLNPSYNMRCPRHACWRYSYTHIFTISFHFICCTLSARVGIT